MMATLSWTARCRNVKRVFSTGATMIEIGRVVMKIAGRDGGAVGVIVDVLDNGRVLVDGQIRRRAVNVAHVEPLAKTVSVSKGASTADVVRALAGIDVVVLEKKNSHKSAVRQPKKRNGKTD